MSIVVASFGGRVLVSFVKRFVILDFDLLIVFAGCGYEMGCARWGYWRSYDYWALHEGDSELPAPVHGPELCGNYLFNELACAYIDRGVSMWGLETMIVLECLLLFGNGFRGLVLCLRHQFVVFAGVPRPEVRLQADSDLHPGFRVAAVSGCARVHECRRHSARYVVQEGLECSSTDLNPAAHFFHFSQFQQQGQQVLNFLIVGASVCVHVPNCSDFSQPRCWFLKWGHTHDFFQS